MGFCLGGLDGVPGGGTVQVDAAVGFYGVGIERHLDEADISARCSCTSATRTRSLRRKPFAEPAMPLPTGRRRAVLVHPGVGHAFYLPGRRFVHRTAAQMAHSPTIALLRRVLGPHYDLTALWEKHCEYEFSTRDARKTMSTMVPSPTSTTSRP